MAKTKGTSEAAVSSIAAENTLPETPSNKPLNWSAYLRSWGTEIKAKGEFTHPLMVEASHKKTGRKLSRDEIVRTILLSESAPTEPTLEATIRCASRGRGCITCRYALQYRNDEIFVCTLSDERVDPLTALSAMIVIDETPEHVQQYKEALQARAKGGEPGDTPQ